MSDCVPGVEVFLSERISQDPHEKFFGCQRQRGHVNENPTVTEFCKNTQKLQVINSVCLDSVKGNCRGKKSTEPLTMEKENRPQPRRKYTSRTTQINCTFDLLLHVCHLKKTNIDTTTTITVHASTTIMQGQSVAELEYCTFLTLSL